MLVVGMVNGIDSCGCVSEETMAFMTYKTFWVEKVLFKGCSVNTLLQLALSPLLKKQGELPIPRMQLVCKVPCYKCDR